MNTKELFKQIVAGNNAGANEVFSSIMKEKTATALRNRKHEYASQLVNWKDVK
jgi:hypothetical protein